jgi:tetratricopeptide (TPR) repeat protein
MLLERHGRGDEAQAAYRRADDLGHAEAARHLGRLLADRGEIAGAEAAYRRADYRGDAEAAYRLGALFEQRGDFDEAEAAYRRADERAHDGVSRKARAALHALRGRN